MPPTDREQELQRLAAENARLAEMEQGLIETIRENKRRLIQLPDIIRQLEAKREFITAEMNRSGAEHDALEAEGEDAMRLKAWVDARADENAELEIEIDDAEFRARANDMADAVTDERATARHPSY